MNIIIKASIISTGLLFTTQINAVPNTFTSGQPARAAEVNANFADVESQISSNSTLIQQNATDILNNTNAISSIPAQITYDYRDFTANSTITSKTFALNGNCGTREVRTFTRTVVNNGTEITMTRKRDTANVVCFWRDNIYLETQTERQLLSGKNYDPTTGELTGTYTLDLPLTLETSSMGKGINIGDAAKISETLAGATPAYFGTIVQLNSALEIETTDVTVPAGTYSGCLKLSSIRRSQAFGRYQQISWKCPGIGEVKRLQSTIDSTGSRVWELESIVTTP